VREWDKIIFQLRKAHIQIREEPNRFVWLGIFFGESYIIKLGY
jgi:hypothetical protein